MSNLATMIMEGTNLGSSSADSLYGDYDFSATALAESSYFSSACATLFSDIMEAEQSWMVADVVGAATAIREQKAGNPVDVAAVQESVLGNGIEKIKSAFHKFIEKVKQFYHKVIDWFKAMFSNAEDFVKKFGSTIQTKATKVKGYKYNGYIYKKEAGDSLVNNAKDIFEKAIDDAIGGLDAAKSASKDEFKTQILPKLSSDFKSDDEKANPSSTTLVEKKFKETSAKADDATELKEKIYDAYRSGDNQKQTIVDFEGNGVGNMCKFLKDSSKVISDLQKELGKFEDKVGKVVNKLNGFKDEGDGSEARMSNASYLAGVISAYLTAYKVPCEARISIYKEMASSWLGALKGFYNYKGTSESVEIFDSAEEYAALESSLVLEAEEKATSGDKPAPDEGDPGEGKGEESATESAVASILEMAANFKF